MKKQYKIALHTENATLYYNDDCNIFGVKHGTIYTSKKKATEKKQYARKYGTSLEGTFEVVEIQ